MIYKFIFTFFIVILDILFYLLFKFWCKYIEKKSFVKTIIDKFWILQLKKPKQFKSNLINPSLTWWTWIELNQP